MFERELRKFSRRSWDVTGEPSYQALQTGALLRIADVLEATLKYTVERDMSAKKINSLKAKIRRLNGKPR